MLKRYEEFLVEFDKKLNKYFIEQSKYIKCKKGCCGCCEIGEYPFSRLEMEYLMRKFITLPVDIRNNIRKEIKHLKEENVKMYKCPFLINKECCVYSHRGIVCRTYGLAWYDDKEDRIKLPYCVNKGLNYSKVFDLHTQGVYLDNPITENLRIDSVLRSEDAKKHKLECGEIRPLLDWF